MEKILIIKCQDCGRTSAAWHCDESAAEMIGLSVIAAAKRGAKIEVVDRTSEGVALRGCDCSRNRETKDSR